MKLLERRSHKTMPYKKRIIQMEGMELKDITLSSKFELKHQNKYSILYFYSQSISDDNYKIIINSDKLTIILSEKKELVKPIYVHNIKLEMLANTDYEKLRSYRFQLPQNNLQIKECRRNEFKGRLEVILAE
jgi:hypothetical protein